MSDTMLLGVLRMPYHALDTELGRIQYYQRGLQAADEIERLRARDQEWTKKATTWIASPEAAQRLAGYQEMAAKLFEAQAEVERLQAENEKLRNERDALRKIILDADAEWLDKEIHVVDSDESYQNWRLVVYLPVPCNVTDKEIESALDRAVANLGL